MLSVNQEAMKLVNTVIDQSEALKIIVSQLPDGSTIIDMGQKAEGSWLAGKYYAEITMGGFGEVTFGNFNLDGFDLPSVCVKSSHPLLAGWVSQKHADPIPGVENQPILAGPAKALLFPPDPSIIYADYDETSKFAVVPLQTDTPITIETTEWISKYCRVNPKNIFILVAPSNSLVCAIQIAARPIDNIMHRLHSEGFDIHKVTFASSETPLATLVKDDLSAMGRINDSMLYGGKVMVYLDGEDSQIERILPNLSTRCSPAYGKLFKQIFLEHDCDFHKIDLRLWSVAKVQINNISTGNCFSTGEIDYSLLKKSFLSNK